ncbi:MAG: hypothetical protein GF398_06615 [Chitinivibrionales bacterium]|nr:hypothetical protein [Chitinivibrionales bacterium]
MDTAQPDIFYHLMTQTDPAQKPASHFSTFSLLLACAVALRLFLPAILPHGADTRFCLEGLNDEPSHYNYTRYLANSRGFPIQYSSTADEDAFLLNEYEYYQPPLNYLLGAPFNRVFGQAAGLYFGRLISVICGLLTLLICYKVLQQLSLSETARKAAVLFLALLPAHAYFCSIVSNDALSWLLAQLILLQLMRIVQLDESDSSNDIIRQTALLGIWLTLGMYTKSSLSMFFPLAVLVLLYSLYSTRDARIALGVATALLTSSLLAAPWYLRNLRLYGSLFALETGFGRPQMWIDSLGDALDVVKATIRLIWFPMQHVREGVALSGMLYLNASVLAAAGALWVRYLIVRRIKSFQEFLLYAALLLSIAAYIRLNIFWFNAEGRYLFPAVTSITYVMIIPLVDLMRRFGPTANYATVALVSLHPWLYLFAVRC